MDIMRMALVGVVVVFSFLAPVSATGWSISESQRYNAANDLATQWALDDPGPCPDVASGSVLCFDLDGEAHPTSFVIEDDHPTADIFAEIRFERPDGAYAGLWWICGFGTLPAYEGTRFVRVTLFTVASVNPGGGCEGREYPTVAGQPFALIGPATTGTVTVAWS